MTPYAEKTKSGDVVWRVAYYVEGRRVRQTFDSKTQAEDWARINRGIGIREGRKFQQLWLSITPKEQHDKRKDSKLNYKEIITSTTTASA